LVTYGRKKFYNIGHRNTVEKKMPWGIILLFGGGFALAAGSDSSGANVIKLFTAVSYKYS
jgi:di/tricarboxylate transporter